MVAIDRVQAIIEFDLTGKILTANENFLGALGYTLPRSPGGITACSSSRAIEESAEYREFWDELGRGEYQAAQYKRIGKGGKEIWIQASYNPIIGAQRQALQGRQVRNRHHRGRS